jgi:hypothetical protein
MQASGGGGNCRARIEESSQTESQVASSTMNREKKNFFCVQNFSFFSYRFARIYI